MMVDEGHEDTMLHYVCPQWLTVLSDCCGHVGSLRSSLLRLDPLLDHRQVLQLK